MHRRPLLITDLGPGERGESERQCGQMAFPGQVLQDNCRKEDDVKKLIFAVLALAFLTVFSTDAFAYRYTGGHYRSNGAYVQPYRSSTPDGFRWNNWSSRGNVNPFTGRRGSRSWF